MATLTGSTVASTYTQLLKLTSASLGADDSAKYIEDGAGTDSALSISTTRVGVGTVAPQSKVDIVEVYSASGSAQEALQLLIRGGEADLSPTGTSIGMGFGYGSANDYVKTGLVHEFIDANGRGKLHLCTSNVAGADTIAKGDARLTITETGNVGIGTVAPNESGFSGDCRVLSIQGSAADGFGVLELITPNVTSSNRLGEIRFVNLDASGSTPAAYAGIRSISDGADDAANLSFWTEPTSGAITQRLVITSAGNVGIGTVGSEKFRVEGTNSTTRLQASNDGGYVELMMYPDQATDNADLRKIKVVDGGTMSFESYRGGSFASDLNIDGATGNVGIGVVPDDSWDTYTALQIGETGAISAHVDGTGAGSAIHITANAYYDSGWKHLIAGSDEASRYTQENGRHQFYTAPASTHANTAAFTEAVRITENGGIYETGGVLKENLLTNSGFDVWSNSGLTSGDGVGRTTDFNVSNILTDTDGSSYASWTATRCTITDGGANLLITETSANQNLVYALSGLTIGKLYKCSFTCGDGTGAWGDETTRLDIAPNGGGTALATITIDDAGTYSLIWEATEVNNQLYLVITSLASGATLTLDDLYVDEVTPGCVAADALACEGYGKGTQTDIWRQHNDGGTLTHDGSFYAMKVTTAAAAEIVYADIPDSGQDPISLQKYAGRTVTLGMWAKTSDASLVRLGFYDSVSGHVRGDYHTGGGGWEWLELTHTFNSAMTQMYIYLMASTGASSGTAYLSQPMLVFGNSIGEGNYTRPQGEWVYTTRKHLTGFSGDSFSDASAQDINLEAVSDGVIPKGAKAIMCRLQARDSDTATGEPYFWLMGHDVNAPQLEADCTFADAAGRDNVYSKANGIVPCSADGDISYYAGASGSNTLDVYITVYAVQLR